MKILLKFAPTWLLLTTMAVFLLSACSLLGSSPATPTIDPDSVKTAAAETAQARLEERNNQPSSTPTAVPPQPTEPPEGTKTPDIAATEDTGTPVPTGGLDAAEFVADVSIPDGSQFAPGDEFEKTWRLKNVGTSIWSPDYNLVYVSGAQMGGPASQPLSGAVSPGETTEISVALIAPEEAGTQRGFWMLQNAQGENFGVGPEANLPFYVDISVLGEGGEPIPTSPPVAGSGVIESLGISVDQSAYSGPCPHTFSFSIQVTTRAPALVTIELVAGAETPGYQYNLPAPQTYNLEIGTYQYVYTLSLTDPVSGWALARVSSPDIVDSNTTSFSLTCE